MRRPTLVYFKPSARNDDVLWGRLTDDGWVYLDTLLKDAKRRGVGVVFFAFSNSPGRGGERYVGRLVASLEQPREGGSRFLGRARPAPPTDDDGDGDAAEETAPTDDDEV